MTTKIAKSGRSATDQVRPTIYDHAKMVAQATISGSTYVTGRSYWAATSHSTAAVVQICEKSAEAQRQIERVRSLSSLCLNDKANSDKCLSSISSTVSLIGAFLTSPIPIPVASGDDEGDTSLFLEGEGIYGDMEISGKQIEYYLKFERDGHSTEYFGTEDIEDGFIPPKLLTRLFYHYAHK
ncbi:MAG: hypothetical protein ACTHJU_12340 [Sphingopyxis sp.]